MGQCQGETYGTIPLLLAGQRHSPLTEGESHLLSAGGWWWVKREVAIEEWREEGIFKKKKRKKSSLHNSARLRLGLFQA